MLNDVASSLRVQLVGLPINYYIFMPRDDSAGEKTYIALTNNIFISSQYSTQGDGKRCWEIEQRQKTAHEEKAKEAASPS